MVLKERMKSKNMILSVRPGLHDGPQYSQEINKLVDQRSVIPTIYVLQSLLVQDEAKKANL